MNASPLQRAEFAAPPPAADQPGRRPVDLSDVSDTRLGRRPERTAESQPLASSLTSTFEVTEGAAVLAVWEDEGGPSVADPLERSDQRTSRGGIPNGLDWSAFSARFFRGRRRHDLEALKAYEAYRNRSETGTG